MIVTSVHWHQHKAIRMVHERCELIITTSVGPRIVYLTYNNSDNILYDDHTGFGVKEWLLYGGHRFTTAPESGDSYFPDNSPCVVNTANDKLKITAPVRPDQLQLSIEISGEINGFKINHILENRSGLAWSGALWAITCIPRQAYVVASCSTDNIHYWPGTDNSNWFVRDDLMHIKSGNFRGKTGWYQPQGWLGATMNHTNLIISQTEFASEAECVDNGCNLEMFACKDWIEIETLSKRVTLLPGQQSQHLQQWSLSEEGG